MPDEGVKDGLGTPPGQQAPGVTPAGTPPVAADVVTPSTDPPKVVPLEALLDERRKRQELEARLQGQEPVDDEPQGFDFDKLRGPAQPPPQQQPNAQAAQQQFLGWFNEEMNSGEPTRQIQAMDAWYQIRRSQDDLLRRQAKTVVPDADNLPTHEITPELRMAVAQNPYLLDAVIARARYGQPKPSPAANVRLPNQPAPPAPQAPPALTPEQQHWYQQGMDAMKTQVAAVGNSGLTGASPSGGAPSGESYDLDPAAVSYYKTRGFNDEQIAGFAKQIVENRKLRSYFGGRGQ